MQNSTKIGPSRENVISTHSNTGLVCLVSLKVRSDRLVPATLSDSR